MKFKFIWLSLFLFCLTFQWGIGTVIAEEWGGSGADIFLLDENDDSEGNIKLQFGSQLAEYFEWDVTNNRFNLSDTLRVAGNLEQDGTDFYLDADNAAAGANVNIVANQGTDNNGTLRYNATDKQWQFSNDGAGFQALGAGGGGLAPYFESVSPSKMAPSSTNTLTVVGDNFDYNTDIKVVDWPGTVNGVRYLSPTEMQVSLTSDATEASYSLVLKNGGLDSMGYQEDLGVDAVTVKTSTWLDLRAGGDTFTDGNGAGNDIRYRAGMGLIRTAAGMQFTGQNPWNSWAKFEGEQFTRGAGTTVEWIFKIDGNMMLGVSGVATDEASGSQWGQGAVVAYFTSATNHWGYYGSSPSNGSTWTQSDAATVTNGGIMKLKIENDGSAGETLTLYQLPSANPSDWDDESNVLNTTVSTNANTQTDLVPFLIPRDSGNTYFVALKVE